MSSYNIIQSFYVMGSCFANNFFQNGSSFRLLFYFSFCHPEAKPKDPLFMKPRSAAARFLKKWGPRFTWIQNLFFEHTYCRSSQQHYKTLVIIRHAHRDTSDKSADNGLSPKGQKQALKIKKYFKKNYPKTSLVIMTSPKKRCVETIESLLKDDLKPTISKLLDEGEPLQSKVDQFIKWWKTKAPSVTVICSHGDWIPVCIKTLTGKDVGLKKGELLEIKLKNCP